MEKIQICVLFGGVSPEHEVSLRSAEFVLNQLNRDRYQVYPVGITKDGTWLLYGGEYAGALPDGTWERHPQNCPAIISPSRGDGLLILKSSGVERQHLDVVFPVLHGKNGEDGTVQGLMQMAGLPCVGPGLAASAVAMDKTLTKLSADHAGITQAAWQLVHASELSQMEDQVLEMIEDRFTYPVFVKPAGTGSSVGVSKACDRETLRKSLEEAAKYDSKILIEEFIRGKEIEVAVIGNRDPIASVCGEIEPGADFYDYEAKYITDSSVAHIPARIPSELADRIRQEAIRVYRALGCRGLSRVDFFLTSDDSRIVLNEINTLPGFTSISMYPKLFHATGMSYPELLDQLIGLAMEASE